MSSGSTPSDGQRYDSVDSQLLFSYTESQDGQILEEGITEAGSMASFTAAGTAYATRGVPMVPFFTFYSMFGFQRVGDLIWAAADAQAKGFLLGATAGRTTLLGEGLQHQDGHSLLLASTVPTCQAYDLGLRLRGRDGRALWPRADVRLEGRQRHRRCGRVGLLLPHALQRELRDAPPSRWRERRGHHARALQDRRRTRWERRVATILFSGSAQGAARAAQLTLAERFGVGAELWSATSYKRLREDALICERYNRLHPVDEPHLAPVTELLATAPGPVIAVTRLHEGYS